MPIQRSPVPEGLSSINGPAHRLRLSFFADLAALGTWLLSLLEGGLIPLKNVMRSMAVLD